VKTRTAFVAFTLLGILHLATIWVSVPATPLPIETSALRLVPSLVHTRAAHLSGVEQQREPPLIQPETSGTLFENVVAVLQKRFYDERFRKDEIPKLAAQYADKASRAKTLGEQRQVVEEFLSHIPASHLGLLSKQTYRYVMADLQGRAYPTFGFQLTQLKGKYYAITILEGGPAQRAGVLTWDRVISIDGVPVEQSPRLDWRSDDAYIGDDRDPPVHHLIAQQGDTIRLKIERSSNKFTDISVAAESYSAFTAAKASAQIYKRDGLSVGYLHFWYVHISGVPELLKEKLEGEFNNCEALVIDLRGRGGNGSAIAKIVDVLREDRAKKNRPIVALVDRQSRSAKDVLAYEFKRTGVARLVGEATAGAVIPATFADVGYDSVLMFPSFKLPRYTDLLEFKPVEPDVFVERARPLSGGNDPILKAGLAEAFKLLKAAAKPASVK
jgi:carboxyl-terminal processing protease